MDPKRTLKGMLARIFSDAVAEEAERAELESFLGGAHLSADDVRAVVDDFVQTTWKITIADGVVSDREKQRLREVVRVLALDPKTLPGEWASLLSE